jgi:hypothetical protein
MKQPPKKRYAVGRRVLVGMGKRPGTVQSVAEAPSVLAEYVHEVLVDGEQVPRRVIGCDMEAIPELDTGLPPQPSHVINVGGGVYGSSIQQATHNSGATISYYKANSTLVRNALSEIRAAADKLELQPNQKTELIADITTVETQLDSSNPKPSIVTECLHSIRAILEHAAGAALGHGIATGLVTQLTKLLGGQ